MSPIAEKQILISDALKAYPRTLPNAWEVIKNPDPLNDVHQTLINLLNEKSGSVITSSNNWRKIGSVDFRELQTNSGIVIARADKIYRGQRPTSTKTPLLVMRILEGQDASTPWIYYDLMTVRGDRDKADFNERESDSGTEVRDLLLESGAPVSLKAYKSFSWRHGKKYVNSRFSQPRRDQFDSLNAGVFTHDGNMAFREATDQDFAKQGVVLKVHGNYRLYLGN